MKLKEKRKKIEHNPHRPYYSSISLKKSSKEATPDQITKMYTDKSTILEDLLQKRYPNKPNELLGELQFAFISFLMGQSYDGFEQWKELLALLCDSESSLYKRHDLFYNFIAVLHFQLEQVPEDFFDDLVTGNNFLTKVLKNFFELTEDPQMDSKVLERASNLKKYVEKRFKIVLESMEEDEDAPVIVEL